MRERGTIGYNVTPDFEALSLLRAWDPEFENLIHVCAPGSVHDAVLCLRPRCTSFHKSAETEIELGQGQL